MKFFVLDDQAYHIMQTLQKSAYLRTTATVLARLNYAALAEGFGVGYNEIACNDLTRSFSRCGHRSAGSPRPISPSRDG